MTKARRNPRALALESIERARLLLEDGGVGDYGDWDYGDVGYGGGGGGGYSGYTGKLYDAFVAPFGRLLKAFKYAAEDILNSLNLVFRTLTTLSPQKLRDARNKYKERERAIGAKWKPIVDHALKVLATSDLGVIAFGLYPQYYLGALFAKGGVDAAVGLLDALSAAGWLSPGWRSRSSSSSRSSLSSTATTTTAGARSLKSQLDKLFGIGTNESRAIPSVWNIKTLLFEAESDAPPGSVNLTEEEFLSILTDPVWTEKTEELRQAAEKAIAETVDNLISDVLVPALQNYKKVRASIEQIKNATSPEAAQGALDFLKSAAPDPSKFDEDSIKKSIAFKKKSDEEIREEIQKNRKNNEKELTLEELDAEVKQAREAANIVLESLGKMASANDEDIVESLKGQIKDIISNKMIPEPKTESPGESKKVDKFIEQQLQKVDQAAGGSQ